MPNRLRTRPLRKLITYPNGGSFQDFLYYYKWIADDKPSAYPATNPVSIGTCFSSPEPVRASYYPPDSAGAYTIVSELNAFQIAETFQRVILPPMDAYFNDRLSRRIRKEYVGLEDKWSAINFLAELSDIPEVIAKVFKPKSIRPIDYYFGTAPLIGDVKEIVTRLNNGIATVQALLDLYAVPTPIRETFRKTVDLADPAYSIAGMHDAIGQCDLTFRAKGVMRVSAHDVLGLDRDFLLMLDHIGFHPDVSTLWNAIPFSWLADWFLPIGDALENAIGGTWFRPEIAFSGSKSLRANLSFDVKTKQGLYYQADSGQYGGQAFMSFYNREAFHGTLAQPQRKLDLKFGVDSPDKLAILRDIIFSQKK
jgi:hypothetical protein